MKKLLVVCLRVLRQHLPGGNEKKQQKNKVGICGILPDLNWLPPEYKSKMLSPELTCSVV
jgi:hypothetical protein